METKTMDRYRMLAGMILFGSLWGMLECVMGDISPTWFPGSAFLGGFVGLGLMVWTRRVYGVMWMQLGMAVVAGAVRFWSPVIGTCVICSALAIMAEGLVFELIFNRPVFHLNRSGPLNLGSARTLASLGIISGFAIFTAGYLLTQIMTPVVTGGVLSGDILVANLPTYVGTGFYAAVFGGVSVPLVMLSGWLNLNVRRIAVGRYFAGAVALSAFCWALVLAFPYA